MLLTRLAGGAGTRLAGGAGTRLAGGAGTRSAIDQWLELQLELLEDCATLLSGFEPSECETAKYLSEMDQMFTVHVRVP